MAVMMGNLYSALKQAGADEASAKQAAEEVASYENRIGDLKADMAGLKTELKTEMAGLRGELTLVKWMVGFNLAMTVALVARLFLSGQS